MQLGMIGLGRMGANMVRRLLRAGHACVGYDASQEAVKALEAEGAAPAYSLPELVERLTPPRSVWLMVPVSRVDEVLVSLRPLLAPGDVVVDGGNSHYPDDIRRASELRPAGVHWIDAGTSGGVFGLERGYCLMVGGEPEPVGRLAPIFDALAPGVDAAPRTPGREGQPPSSAERGWLHCGPPGAGHFVKMVHNGIEYGIMAAYAEGLNVLRHADAGLRQREGDAETTPLAHPERYRFRFALDDVTEVWRRGSVIGSWLLDLTAQALADDPGLARFAGSVSDSGEGRWTIQAAIDESVPVPVLSAALYDRFASRGEAHFGHQVLSAMRFAFGGHVEKRAGDAPAGAPAPGARSAAGPKRS
jgi:6-phosphogluconate dehydrogenase